MTPELAMAVEVRRRAVIRLKAWCSAQGIRPPASPAQMHRQAQAHVTPELIAEARKRVEGWFAGSKTTLKATKPKA